MEQACKINEDKYLTSINESTFLKYKLFWINNKTMTILF